MSEELKAYKVPSVDSACRMLRAIGQCDEPLSLAELMKLADTSRTTAMRIASSLVSQGVLEREESGKYGVGQALRIIGSRVHSESGLRQSAVPVLKELVRKTEETAHLLIPLETHGLLQEVIDNPRPVRVASRPGTLVDYHCSAGGKAILAFRDDLVESLRESMALGARTVNTMTTWKQLDAALEEVRQRGYAIDQEEYHEGVRCLGAPVRDHSGRVIGAIGVTGATSSLTKRRLPQVARLVMEAAQELSLTQ